MAASPVVLPPPPYPPAPDPAAPTYYNFVGLDGLGTVPGPTECFQELQRDPSNTQPSRLQPTLLAAHPT